MITYHITPGEAIELARYTPCSDAQFAREIAMEYIKQNGPHCAALADGICYHAGIVEGVRRERARRRTVKGTLVFQRTVYLLQKIKTEKAMIRIYRLIQLLWRRGE